MRVFALAVSAASFALPSGFTFVYDLETGYLGENMTKFVEYCRGLSDRICIEKISRRRVLPRSNPDVSNGPACARNIACDLHVRDLVCRE